MNGPVPLRSQLSRYCTDRRDPEKVARDGWRQTGIAAINVADPRLDDFERRMVTNIANRLYGVRA